jgi:hypothetical protein
MQNKIASRGNWRHHRSDLAGHYRHYRHYRHRHQQLQLQLQLQF